MKHLIWIEAKQTFAGLTAAVRAAIGRICGTVSNLLTTKF
jgi:hypothetical protein